MNEQQEHLSQLIEQRNNLSTQLENIQGQSVRAREVLLKTLGAIEYLEAVGVTLPEPEVTEEAEAEAEAEAPAEEG